MPELTSTLARAFKILDYIAAHEGCSIAEIATELGLNKNTVQNMVNALKELGLVEKKVGGMPRKAIIVLTEKGKCIHRCFKSGT